LRKRHHPDEYARAKIIGAGVDAIAAFLTGVAVT